MRRSPAQGYRPWPVAMTYDNAGNMTGQTRYSNLDETDVVAGHIIIRMMMPTR